MGRGRGKARPMEAEGTEDMKWEWVDGMRRSSSEAVGGESRAACTQLVAGILPEAH